MSADPLSLLATACCTRPPTVARIATGTASAFAAASSTSPKTTTHLVARPLSPRHTPTMSATTTPATAAVRLPPCASLYAAGGGTVAFAAKSDSEDCGLAPFPSPGHAPTGSACPASLAYYALALSHCVSVNGPRLGEEGTAAAETAAGEPSHLPWSTANNLPVPAPAELVQPGAPARTTALSPRARQRPSSPASAPRSAAEPTGAKPHRSFANLLADPQQHDLAAHHPWSAPQGGHAGSTAPLGNDPTSLNGRTSTSSPRPSISAIPQAAHATSHALADASKLTSAAGNASLYANVAPYPPTPPEPTSATLHGLLPSVSVSNLAAASSYPGDSRPSSASKSSLERGVSVTLSTQDELADDSGAASGSQGEGSASCQDKAGGKPKKELKGSKRAEQNRAAQRAFRERKEQKLRSLQELVGRIPEFEEKLASLSAHCASLEADRASLLAERRSFINERASWDRERRCLLGEIDALRRVLDVEKATSMGTMPGVGSASAAPATSVGPLSPKSGSGSHSADASPSPRPPHCDALTSDHRRASTSGSGSFQSSLAPLSAHSEAPLRSEIKREAPDDFEGPQPPFKRVDLHAS